MTFQTETKIGATRKPHRCDFCMGTIPKGSIAIKQAGKWDGDFYYAYGHRDCVEMWGKSYHVYADYDYGMPHDLLEAIGDGEGTDIVLHELSLWRGQFPHVVTRLEYRIQKSEIAYADQLRARGVEPHPEDYEPIYG